jgi:hypothetical protein
MRRPHDAYYTPASACDALKRHWQGWENADLLLEPCLGNGAIVESFPEKEWKTNDIDISKEADTNLDLRSMPNWDRFLFPRHTKREGLAVITNPPFSLAFWFAHHARFYCERSALLLRLSFLEPTRQRGPWLERYPPDLVIVLPRISFTGDGKTDSVTCAWMIWDAEIKNRGVIVSPRLAPQSARSQAE